MNGVQCCWAIIFICVSLIRFGGSENSVPVNSETNSTILNDSNDSLNKDNSSDVEHGQDINRNLEPSVEDSLKQQSHPEIFTQQQVIAEATSLNSGAANQITNNGPQVFVTLTDGATEELQNRAVLPEETQSTESEYNKTQSEELERKDNLTEEIPSFSEWTQKQIEAEKVKETTNNTTITPQSPGNGNKKVLRWKNYASVDCGAKVVASNPEAVSPSAVLSPSRDEYKLNTCTSRIWFVVELCEAIQAKKIDFANFELFSSSPKDFSVFVSDRFPTRDWSNVGQFTAEDERDIQSFDLHPHLFGKYIKVEVKSHYGSEHYCPISLFRVYGTSEFEVLQKEDQGTADDDDDVNDENSDTESGGNPKNLFSSATDAVISIVKKAASVLGPQKNQSNQTGIGATIKNETQSKICTTLSHIVICNNNCTQQLFSEIYELLSCYRIQIEDLVAAPLIKEALVQSDICKQFGLELGQQPSNPLSEYMNVLFPQRFLGAMCNHAAFLANQLALNVTIQFANITQSKSEDIVKIETSELNVITSDSEAITDTIVVTSEGVISKTTSVTDTSITSQISPTRTITSDLVLDQNLTSSSSTPIVDADKINRTETDKSVNTTGETVQYQNISGEHEDNTTENIESIELEHLINDLNGDGQSVSKTPTNAPQAQKESVFLRLSNRIKALERNMSLSTQYLEELSKRYKKQVEEMQKVLDKTVLTMTEDAKRIEERNKHLEDKLETLTANVEAMLAEKKSWSSTIFCIVISSLTTFFIIMFCHNKSPETKQPIKKPEITRRRSLDEITTNRTKKKRRPSDQALKIVRTLTDNVDHQNKRKRKKKVIKRSTSINTLDEDGEYSELKPQTMSSQVWNRQESAPPRITSDWIEAKRLEDVPFALEESEHSFLEPLDENNDSRITPPNFLRTALNTRETRSNSTSPRKSPFLDEASRIVPVNGNANSDQAKKGKSGLKKIFKKVF